MKGDAAGVHAPSTAATRQRSERGAVLLVVVLMAAATMAVSTSLIERASLAAGELRARRGVLCARYAAFGGLAAGTPMSGAAATELVGGRADSLAVWRVRRSPSWCVLRATATCDGASRTLERTLVDTSLCNEAAP